MITSHNGTITVWLEGGPLDGSTREAPTSGTGLDEEIPLRIEAAPGAFYELTSGWHEGLIVYRFAG